MAIELPPEEQVEDKDLIREFLRLTKMIVNSCEKEWQNVFIEMDFVVGVWSPVIMWCFGQVHITHEYDFVEELKRFLI